MRTHTLVTLVLISFIVGAAVNVAFSDPKAILIGCFFWGLVAGIGAAIYEESLDD